MQTVVSFLRLEGSREPNTSPEAGGCIADSIETQCYRDTAPFGKRRRFVSMIASTSISTSSSGIARLAQ